MLVGAGNARARSATANEFVFGAGDFRRQLIEWRAPAERVLGGLVRPFEGLEVAAVAIAVSAGPARLASRSVATGS